MVHNQTDGFAVQAGVQIKLPMLAAGDDLWLEGAYQEGGYLYMDSASGLNAGFNALAVGGLIHQDVDAVAVPAKVTAAAALATATTTAAMNPILLLLPMTTPSRCCVS